MSVMAISRGSLFATIKLAEVLRDRLGYKVISREEVIEAAGRNGIEETGLGEKGILEAHPPGYWHQRSDQRMHLLPGHFKRGRENQNSMEVKNESALHKGQ